jgi:hypothetical protein
LFGFTPLSIHVIVVLPEAARHLGDVVPGPQREQRIEVLAAVGVRQQGVGSLELALLAVIAYHPCGCRIRIHGRDESRCPQNAEDWAHACDLRGRCCEWSNAPGALDGSAVAG